MPGVVCDRQLPARVKGEVYNVAVRLVMLHRLNKSGTDEKTGGGNGGGRIEDATIFIRSDKNGQDNE